MRDRLSTLDGWRGAAILLVLMDHMGNALFDRRYKWLELGRHGVAIFFVLSGYLITSTLLSCNGSLKQFYLRRLFRLAPAAWIYLLVVAALDLAIHRPIIPDLLPCLLFFRNYAQHGGPLTLHFWSLSVEEQFYLLWPPLLLFLGRRRVLWFSVLGASACALYRFTMWPRYDNTLLSTRTEVQFDGLLVGCMLGLVLEREQLRMFFARNARAVLACTLPLFVVCVFRYTVLIPLSEVLLIAATLTATMLNLENPVSRALQNRWLVRVGLGSYSLYLWQEILIDRTRGALWFVGAALLPAIAMLSYSFERHMIEYGRRWSAASSPIGATPDFESERTASATIEPSRSC